MATFIYTLYVRARIGYMYAMPTNYTESFGRRLHRLRRSAGFRNRDSLAEYARVSSSSISHYELDNHLPSLTVFLRLVDACAVSADILLGRETETVVRPQSETRRLVQRLLDEADDDVVDVVRRVLVTARRSIVVESGYE